MTSQSILREIPLELNVVLTGSYYQMWYVCSRGFQELPRAFLELLKRVVVGLTLQFFCCCLGFFCVFCNMSLRIDQSENRVCVLSWKMRTDRLVFEDILAPVGSCSMGGICSVDVMA